MRFAAWKWVQRLIVLSVLGAGAGIVQAQTLTDIGAANPTPGPSDISQLSTNGNQRLTGSFNYYTDNINPPGQTFTAKSGPLVLTSVSLRTGTLPPDSGGGGLGPQAYELRIFAVSGYHSTLMNSYTSSPAFSYVDGDWLRWTNLAVPLVTNADYAYTFRRSTIGYDGLAVTSSNYYSGGEAALIPNAGGTVTFQSGHNFDAAFDLGMANTGQLLAGTPIALPAFNIYIGSALTLRSPALGTAPLYYQWQTDGGGAAVTNIPGANGSSLVLTPASTGTFRFDVIVTNISGSATSAVVNVTVLPPVPVGINVSNTLATMPLQGLGVCSAVYDNVLINYPSIATQLKTAGISAVRYPGGSSSDVYCWTNNKGIDGAYVNSNDGFDNFMNDIVNPAGAQAIITVNYGSNPGNTDGGDTNVAAAWVNYANNTKHWGVKYWEIGNEVGGNGYYAGQDWEYDLHYPETNAATRIGQPALSPAAYGSNAVQFIQAMKNQDPTILCGIGFSPGNNSYNTPLLQACGTNADFVIIHWYPGSDAASTLAASASIPSTVNSTLTELTNQLGAARASQMQIAVTETGAGNATGAAVALYAADNYLTWIENGIVNVDYQILHTDMLLNNQTPGHAYYGAMMSHLLANVGDTMLNATSALSGLRVHATARQDGKTGVMLANMDPVLPISATVTISGPNLASSGTWYQFGLTNYLGANDAPAYPVSSNTVSGLGNQFTVLVPPYTLVDLLIPTAPSNTPPVLNPVADFPANVGSNIVVTASATDTDSPPQTLTVSLLSGPANASLTQINNTNANVNWRPLVTQADTTNLFSLKVADNGTPSLSATQSFTVTVNPLTLPSVSSGALSNGQLTLQVTNSIFGPDYAVQVSSNLFDWSTVFITNSPAMPFSWTDTNAATLPVQFYRIKVGPPLP